MAFDLARIGVKRNIPKVDYKDYSGIIQGEVKVGKTTLASLMPKTILVGFEEGYTDKVIDYIDCTGEDGWNDFIEFIDMLEEHREEIGNDIKLIVIDTAEKSYEVCGKYTVRRKAREDGKAYREIGDIPHGKGYLAKDDDYRAQIARLYQLGFKPVYLTHTQIKTVRPKDSSVEPYDVIVPTIPDRLKAIIEPEVSYIMNIQKATIDGVRTRILNIAGAEGVEVGSRVYIDDDITFDTEEEALEKFEQAWQKVIEGRLVKAGITESLEELAVKQDKERVDKAVKAAKENVEKDKCPFTTNQELSEWAKELVRDKKITQKKIVEILGTAGHKSFSTLETPEQVAEAYKLFNEVVA